ncbi:Glu-tRNA(Gln) amidotransferase subunit GatE [Halodesulfurarchaeum sp.]|uniref:Glu-tRNA(Gln) amidotransferase subunit GatE n=1 Tax=Halodesulfurarchaeum sp. TaxID=1980530 RepID=UPI002FC317FE
MTGYDPADLGLVAGLEIHQQLDTDSKLFCSCPTTLREESEAAHRFNRYLHPTPSELGEIDEAALEESRVDREFEYLSYDTTCLVEEDDEPPHPMDQAALETTLETAQLLAMTPVDQAHVMRKVVIDGSNTSGFQRTSLIATDGYIETEDGKVGIEDLMLEEESARRVEETESGVVFSLDRLGIPLVEIGTKPDISSPEQAREAAERIGMILRSTGAVKRGLGTIRQDVNVSIEEGARVEVKGVQDLDGIEAIVRGEVDRQGELLEIAGELQDREASVGDVQAVTDVFSESESGVIRSALDTNGAVYAVPLFGFDGVVGWEIQPDRRLGTELSDHAKRNGAGGIFHTDELPAYGITESEVSELEEAVNAGENDAVAIVAAETETAELAIEAAAERAVTAIQGVPEETRDANEDGTTSYLRPLPGAARMYPETDVPPVEIDPATVEPPELLDEKVNRYVEEFDLDPGLADQVAFGRNFPAFEQAVEQGVDASLAATTIESTTTELRRDDVPIDRLRTGHFLDVLGLVSDGELAKEGVGPVLEELAEDPSLNAQAAIEAAGLGGVDKDAVRNAVIDVLDRNRSQVAEDGMGAFSALMGEAMGELRGKADGEVVSEILREEIQKQI